MDNWNEKLKGLLHDPVYKFLNIKGHEKALSEIYEKVGLTDAKAKADSGASAMDRFLFPQEHGNCATTRICQNFIGKNAVWKHSLGGSNVELKVYSKMPEDQSNSVFESLAKTFQKDMIDPIKDYKTPERHVDYKRMFLKLWWDLPYWTEKNLKTQLIPAETRMPNHSILDHIFMTSALSGVKDPAFLFISIGPVQSFIASARKTVDLWAGSYLLSQLSLECMLEVAEEFGPDAIVFPDLHKQKRVKEWIESKSVQLIDKDTLDDFYASMPNKFLAIVESSEAESLANKIENNLRVNWMSLTDKAKSYFKSKGQLKDEELWDRQVKTFPEFYHSVTNWPKEPKDFYENFKNYFGQDFDKKFSDFYSTMENVKKANTYELKIGAFYGLIFEMARRDLDSVKLTTLFGSYTGKDGIDNDNLSGLFEHVVSIKVENDTDDKLNALDAVKRYCADEKYKSVVTNHFKVDGHIPSTDEIAVGKLLPDDKKREIKKEGAKIGVLLMDGDQMGKWISGQKAPIWENSFSDFVLNHQTFKESIKENFLKSKRFVYPAYHRAITSALTNFTDYVDEIISDHGGLLIYAGGDDVMAFLPAPEVFACANDLRKAFCGKDLKLKDVEFKDGFIFKDDIPIKQVMGLNASMSAGIAVGHYEYPLSELLRYARKAETKAKEDEGRNAFALYTVRRSGQVSFSSSKWDSSKDIIELSEDILKFMDKSLDDERISPKLVKLLSERKRYPDSNIPSFTQDIKAVISTKEKDVLENYISYLIEKRLSTKLSKEQKEAVKTRISSDLFKFLEISDEIKEDLMIKRTTLLNEMLFAKRGDER